MDELLNNLDKLAVNNRLESQALEGAKKWVSSKDFDIDNSVTRKFKYEFHANKLCFKHEFKAVPYIETYFNIVLDEVEVGYYCWVSDLNGEVLDDLLVITDRELKCR
ncbi:hypothetical protein MJO52_09165 [Microbulbifer variabilis]|uniref:Uncharacterized protein n=1 Tax=Microbulbifer variabilis TaxID=266805 RepID=A0ABY4VG51_9GAMM|nr:hypothetical protein [Microbulbifer variabilis]USD23290.1 hypothetical protein MJO52_09165 [Microbulbifer variabilis]